jgi:LAO/AO transport system kinase
MEIADLFVVNKADCEGADEMATEIAAMLDLCTFRERPVPGIVKTSATKGTGIGELMSSVRSFRDRKRGGSSPSRGHVREEILALVEREVSRLVRGELNRTDGSAAGDLVAM